MTTSKDFRRRGLQARIARARRVLVWADEMAVEDAATVAEMRAFAALEGTPADQAQSARAFSDSKETWSKHFLPQLRASATEELQRAQADLDRLNDEPRRE